MAFETQDDLTQGGADSSSTTGEPTVDAAVAELAGLDQVPLSEHHDRLTRVHDVLHQALDSRHD